VESEPEPVNPSPSASPSASPSPSRHLCLLALALTACGPTTLAPPRIDTITPARAPEGVATDIDLHGDGFLASILTDFRRASRSTLSADIQVTLLSDTGDAFPCEAPTLLDPHTVHALVPATLPRGLYDLQLVDAQGRGTTLAGSFSVVTPAESVARFEVLPIVEQHARVPFPLRVLALDDTGRLVESFEGRVQLSDDTGTLAPTSAGPFTRGRLDAFVSVATLTAADVIHLQDALGHAGQSVPFAVTPGPPMQLAFANPPALMDAGSCQGPFHLALQDAWGFAATATADVSVTLAALPATGAGLFSDASCATAATSLLIPPGGAGADLWVRDTLAGALSVRAVPDALPSAEAQVTVRPQPPSKLVIAAAPGTVKVGECSAAIDVESRDGFDNTAPPSMSTDLALATTPAAGVALFADATCSTALGPLSLDGSRASVRLFVRSSATGTLELDVSAAGSAMLAPTSVDVEVTP